MRHFKLKEFLFLLILLFSFNSCNSTRTALFDQYSYKKTIELKVKTTSLINKASTPYSENKIDIDNLFLDIEKLIEYEKNKPDNKITFQMWKVLNDSEKNLLAGFFKNWQAKETLSEPYIDEFHKQMLEAFDLLIQYEIKKDNESKNNLLDFINFNH